MSLTGYKIGIALSWIVVFGLIGSLLFYCTKFAIWIVGVVLVGGVLVGMFKKN